MARLDRLGPAKEVAQIGAAIGREFSDELINAIARRPEAELKAALDRLIEAGLLFGHGVLPHRTYLFKHALVRDAAYSTLLRGRRQELHRQIVSALQQDFPELVVSQPEMLAHHSAESGMLVEAIEYYVLAAKRATAAMNNKEAKAHLKRGMTLLEQLPASDPRRPKLLSRVGMRRVVVILMNADSWCDLDHGGEHARISRKGRVHNRRGQRRRICPGACIW